MIYAKNTKPQVIRRPLFYLPLIFGIIFIAGMIVHYGHNIPGWDQWEMVPLFQKVDHHALGLKDLWHQHNEHRIFFPLAVLLGSAYLTHWNTGAELIINLMLASVTAVVLFLLLKKAVGQSWMGMTAGVLFAAWFFSPIQWENWLWGWQLEWFMAISAGVLSIFLLLKFSKTSSGRNRKLLFVLAGLTAFIATFSLASGVFVWLIGILLLLATKQNKKIVIAWTTAALLTSALYYYHYVPVPSPTGSPLHVVLHHPFLFAEFFFAYIAGPIGSTKSNLQAPDILGALLVLGLLPLLVIVWSRRKNLHPYLAWLALMLFAVLAALSTAFGRLGYGVEFALSSRYSAFSLLYVIGLTGLGFTTLNQTANLNKKTQQLYVSTIILLTLPLLASSYAIGFHGFKSHNILVKEIVACTHQQNPSDACLTMTYPSAKVVRPRLEYLKTKHWGGF